MVGRAAPGAGSIYAAWIELTYWWFTRDIIPAIPWGLLALRQLSEMPRPRPQQDSKCINHLRPMRHWLTISNVGDYRKYPRGTHCGVSGGAFF